MGDSVAVRNKKAHNSRQLTKKSKKHAVAAKRNVRKAIRKKVAKSALKRPGSRIKTVKGRLKVGKKAIKRAKAVIKATKVRAAWKAKAVASKKEKAPEKPVKKELTEKEIAILQQEHAQKISRILSDSSVRQNLIGIGGENALAIVRSFYGNHSDEEIAKKLKIKISDVRATLNRLHNEGLVNYIREKDSETGWYSYSWSLNHTRMERWATSQVMKLSAIAGNGVDYYFCPSCGASSITNFESAADMDFRCERCNRLLEFIDERKMTELHERKV